MLIDFLFLAAEAAKTAEPAGVNAWIATGGAVLAALITGIVSWLSNRGKNESDQFIAFMQQSTGFRDELRKERDAMKTDLEVAKKEIEQLRKRLYEYEYKMRQYEQSLIDCQEQAAAFLKEIAANKEQKK
jgi:septal ring factor EnvC (AmiA/AmiB activator)